MKRKENQPRHGAAAIEFAVVLPILALLFVICVDFARVFFYSATLWNCARQGALYGSDPTAAAQSPYTGITQAALADAQDITPAPTVTSTTGQDTAGNAYVCVTLSWTFTTLIRYPGVGDELQLTRTVQMRISPATPQ